jgi:hypothetical protein
MNLVDYLKRSKLKTREDLVRFLDNFDNNATSWRNATQEIMDISRTSREYLEEYDNIKVDPVDFRMISRTKKPSNWNIEGKASVLNNFDKMSTNTQKEFLKEIEEMFSE